MNKVLKSLVVGGLGLMMLPGMVKADIEGQETLGSYSNNAFLNRIENGNTYEIAISWGDLSYDYVKQSDGSYAWIPVVPEPIDGLGDPDATNYIEVLNLSTAEVEVSIDWKTAITGVTASYDTSVTNFENLGCTMEYSDGVTWWWNNTGSEEGYLTATGGKYYTDEDCTNEVIEGTLYESGKYYYKIPTLDSSTSSKVILPQSDFIEDRYAYSKVQWWIDLAGGDYENVKTAYKSDDKIIGSFTITIGDLEDLD